MAYSEGQNRRGKTHFALCEQSNESNPITDWYDTLCGLEYTESSLTDEEDLVTCKNCIKTMESHNDFKTIKN